ncbi:cytochrome P450 [Lophiotrema nucula]|uniref:Cytochrome P450 n=1 Tax=Lophiotrema nucula TaxID=690887 RepID=A0A6A5YLE7_9PLEO|nr:cytochrome P450 [Lophiotrema nucula]
MPGRWRLDQAARYAHTVLELAVQRYEAATAINAQEDESFTLLDTGEARETLAHETDWARHSIIRLPVMDSFIMEVIRFHPPSVLFPQRKAREAFTLSNGIHVPVGTHFGIPLGPVTHDPDRYLDPEQFDAFRNYKKRKAEGLFGQSSKYMATTPTEDHLIFGHGAQACPGRFFAVNEIKLILMFFLLDFEFRRPDSHKGAAFILRTRNTSF